MYIDEITNEYIKFCHAFDMIHILPVDRILLSKTHINIHFWLTTNVINMLKYQLFIEWFFAEFRIVYYFKQFI